MSGGVSQLSAHTITRRGQIGLALLAILLLAAPLFATNYIVSVLTLCLFTAYFGQAWNVMMGFCGQLSLGHSLYVGLGAYTAGALFVHYQVPPWIGLFVGAALAAAMGGVVGFLGFRFGVKGVYLALLTIAFAEFTRILFDHFAWVGGSSGLFLPVGARGQIDVMNLRGSPLLIYYAMLVLTAAAFWLCHRLLTRRIGYYWLAIREDQDAAEALGIDSFRYKILAVMLSAAMTAVGGAFYAFYYNTLFPETTFSMLRSIDLILGPIIGGLGTLFGPILGGFALTILGEALGPLTEHVRIDGLKHIIFGLCLVVIVLFRREGLWPWVCRRLGLGR